MTQGVHGKMYKPGSKLEHATCVAKDLLQFGKSIKLFDLSQPIMQNTSMYACIKGLASHYLWEHFQWS